MVSINSILLVNAIRATELVEMNKKDIIGFSRLTGIPPSIALIQLIGESGHEASSLAVEDNNWFGIKWADSFAEKYPGAYPVSRYTTEEINGSMVGMYCDFTHFPTAAACIQEHCEIWWNGYYDMVLDVLYDLDSTTEEIIEAIGRSPYAFSGYGPFLLSIYYSNQEYYDSIDNLAYPQGRQFCGLVGERTVGEYNYPDDGYNLDSVTDVGTVTTNENGESTVIVKEEDLRGMVNFNILFNNQKAVDLPSSDNLSTRERVNLERIRSMYLSETAWSFWDTVRVGVVFLGLVLLLYMVLAGVGYIFDKVNFLFDISILSIISFGVLHYSDVEEDTTRGAVTKSRIIKLEIALLGIGLLLVSGGVFNYIVDILYMIQYKV